MAKRPVTNLNVEIEQKDGTMKRYQLGAGWLQRGESQAGNPYSFISILPSKEDKLDDKYPEITLQTLAKAAAQGRKINLTLSGLGKERYIVVVDGGGNLVTGEMGDSAPTSKKSAMQAAIEVSDDDIPF